MTEGLLANLITFLQIAVLAVLIVRMIRLTGHSKKPILPLFFAFALISFLFSDLYWIAYDLLRPDTRMPFAANEIGEWAAFLLFTAGLSAFMSQNRKSSLSEQKTVSGEMVFAAFFAAGNTALWIAWTGEWIQDIITGLVFGALICTLARMSRISGIFSKKEKILIAGTGTLLILLQTVTFFVTGRTRAAADICCYILLSGGIVFFFFRTIKGFQRKKSEEGLLCLSCCSFSWTLAAMYMSEGIPYMISVLMNILALPFMAAAVKREVYRE